jgi:hypothetical protein
MADQKKIYRWYMMTVCLAIISGTVGVLFDIGEIGSYISFACLIPALVLWIAYAAGSENDNE